MDRPGVVVLKITTAADVASLLPSESADVVVVVQAEDAAQGAAAAEALGRRCRAVFVGPDTSAALAEFLREMGWA